ncbi:OmpA family protein [Photobacterium japonica]|uniref:OmpA family protein n=1 Tax=Photobacterium japonica TaxID=2910235 RepID=UPI003D0B0E26
MRNKIMGVMFCLPFTALANDAVNQGLTDYCDAGPYTVEHTVTIGDVTALGNHRQGWMQIAQTSQDAELKAQLLALAEQVGISEQCIAFLDGKQLLTTEPVPEAEPEKAPAPTHTLLARVYFDFDRATLTPMSKVILKRIAQKLETTGQFVRLEGNTDNKGSETYNYALGLKRANQTGDFMAEHGVNKAHMINTSQGEAKPISSNATAIGRDENRRVDVYRATP